MASGSRGAAASAQAASPAVGSREDGAAGDVADGVLGSLRTPSVPAGGEPPSPTEARVTLLTLLKSRRVGPCCQTRFCRIAAGATWLSPTLPVQGAAPFLCCVTTDGGGRISSPQWNSPRGQALSQVWKGLPPSLPCWDLLPPGSWVPIPH